MFRFDIRRDTGQSALSVAKTWIPYSALSDWDLDVIDDTGQAVMAWRAAAPAKDVAYGLALIGGLSPPAITDALAAAFERHIWLRTPYIWADVGNPAC